MNFIEIYFVRRLRFSKMVRFYILPNADHLQEDELNFEISLRDVQIELDAKLEDRRRALRYQYKTERQNPKLYCTNLSIADEIENLDETIKSLKHALKKEFDYTIVSRIRFYLIRIAASIAVNEEEEKRKQEYCKQIEEMLRAHRQRVTYDPNQSNDETDLDLGNGAKGLRPSWRNPDPSAIVETSKNKLHITGTIPKDKKLKSGKETEIKSVNNAKRVEVGQRKEDRKRPENRIPAGDALDDYRKKDKKRTSNIYRKHSRDNRRQKYRYSSSYGSSSEYSGTDEYDQSENERHKIKHKNYDRSKGRGYLSSECENSSDYDEEEERQWYRNYHRSQTPPRRHRNNRDEYHRTSRSRVENWDIVFSGDARSMQVEDFLNRVKKLARHERVGTQELLDKIHYKLKGEASDWWFTRENRCTTWEKFENEIRFRFGNPNRDRGIRSQLRELRQKRGETFVAFVTEVEKLNQCLKRPHSSRTIFEIVWENMRPHYRSKLATVRVSNLEKLLDLNHRIDANDPSLYRSGQGLRNEVHNIDAQSNSDSEYSSEEYVVNALQKKLKIAKDSPRTGSSVNLPNTQTTDLSAVKCWNCQKTGHHWRACKEIKLIFCYACGNIGRTTKTCERNHPQFTPSTQQHQQSLNYQRGVQ